MYESPIWMVSGGSVELCLGSSIEYHWMGLGRYLEHASLDEWLYNSGAQQFIVCHFFIGICGYMGREWELSYRLGMRPWIAVAYSAPVIAATAVFVVYPIGHARVPKPEKALRWD